MIFSNNAYRNTRIWNVTFSYILKNVTEWMLFSLHISVNWDRTKPLVPKAVETLTDSRMVEMWIKNQTIDSSFLCVVTLIRCSSSYSFLDFVFFFSLPTFGRTHSKWAFKGTSFTTGISYVCWCVQLSYYPLMWVVNDAWAPFGC